jgi:hypothetical protein
MQPVSGKIDRNCLPKLPQVMGNSEAQAHCTPKEHPRVSRPGSKTNAHPDLAMLLERRLPISGKPDEAHTPTKVELRLLEKRKQSKGIPCMRVFKDFSEIKSWRSVPKSA